MKQLNQASADLVRREAERVVQETRAKSQFPPAYRINIGGRFSAVQDGPLGPLRVNSNEAIALQFDHRREVAYWAMHYLHAMSPVVSGDYLEGHTVFLDGVAQGELTQALRGIRPGVVLEIVNVMPYARRLEVGKNADGTPFVKQVSPNIVQRAGAKVTGGIYKKVADVFFSYRDISDPHVLSGALIGTTYIDNLGRRRKRKDWHDRRIGSPIRYPAVIIKEPRYGL